MAVQLANSPASLCTTPPYLQFAQLKNFPAAVTWCTQLTNSKTKPAPIPGCPVGSNLCAVLAILENNAYNIAATACSCIGHGPTATVSVTTSSTSKSLSTSKSSSTSSKTSTTTTKTSSSSSTSTSKTSITPSVTPSVTPSITPSVTPTTSSTSTTSSLPAATICPGGNAPVIDPTCTTVHSDFNPDLAFNNYYSGHGFTENLNNPGNHNASDPPVTIYVAGNYTNCDAARYCANSAYDEYPNSYASFDLHYLCSASQWECATYLGPNTDPSYFNVPNPDVLDGFGFSSIPHYFDGN